MGVENKSLPEGWEAARVQEICIVNPKHDPASPDQLEVSFIPMAAVDDGRGEITVQEIRRLGEVRKGYTHFADDDVIWAKITPCMENGKAALARELKSGLACGSTEFFVLRSRGAILPAFLYQYIRQESFRLSKGKNGECRRTRARTEIRQEKAGQAGENKPDGKQEGRIV